MRYIGRKSCSAAIVRHIEGYAAALRSLRINELAVAKIPFCVAVRRSFFFFLRRRPPLLFLMPPLPLSFPLPSFLNNAGMHLIASRHDHFSAPIFVRLKSLLVFAEIKIAPGRLGRCRCFLPFGRGEFGLFLY